MSLGRVLSVKSSEAPCGRPQTPSGRPLTLPRCQVSWAAKTRSQAESHRPALSPCLRLPATGRSEGRQLRGSAAPGAWPGLVRSSRRKPSPCQRGVGVSEGPRGDASCAGPRRVSREAWRGGRAQTLRPRGQCAEARGALGGGAGAGKARRRAAGPAGPPWGPGGLTEGPQDTDSKKPEGLLQLQALEGVATEGLT